MNFEISKIPDPVEARLAAMGIDLPPPPLPVAEYVPAKCVGNLVFVSGQGPIRNGRPVYVGRLGADLTLAEGYDAARLSVLNCLAVLKMVLGSLDRVAEVIQVRGFISSSPDFHDQSRVLDGASELLVKAFGARGRHARAALGTCVLPGNIPVEVELVVRVAQTSRRTARTGG